jgi:hypothetical protein
LKNFLCLILITFSFKAWSCWKVSGTIAVDGQNWDFTQSKMESGKTISFPLGPYIFNLTGYPKKDLPIKFEYELLEKQGSSLVAVTQGSEIVKPEKKSDILARGNSGQPHTIITILFSHH